MSDFIPEDLASETTLRRLRDLSRSLLRLHKALLDNERDIYEQTYGRVSGGELYRLVLNHEQFAWLRPISELIVRIDELLDADDPLTIDDAESLFAQTRSLLSPSESGAGFDRKYFDALQREPAAVLAHREVKQALAPGV